MSELMIAFAKTPAQIIASDEEFDTFFRKIREEIETHQPDTSTKKGRTAIASLAHKIARTKTAIDKAGDELIADARAVVKKTNEARKAARDKFDALKAEVRRPLTDWEDDEEKRIARFEGEIEEMIALGRLDVGISSTEIQTKLDMIRLIDITPDWEEFEARALRIRGEVRDLLEAAKAKAIQDENEAIELQRLRDEKAERDRAEQERLAEETRKKEIEVEAARIAQAEIDRKAAAAKAAIDRAEKEKVAAIQAQAEAEQERQLAEAERRAAEERAARAAENERDRIEMEAAAKVEMEREAKAKRIADQDYRNKALGAAAEGIVQAGHIGMDKAEAILAAINAGSIPHVRLDL